MTPPAPTGAAVALAPALRPIPDLGEHQLVASQLATDGDGTGESDGLSGSYRSDHLGRVVAVEHADCTLAGRLIAVADSMTAPLLVLTIGSCHTVAVHPTHPVTVAPYGHRLIVTARPACKADGDGRTPDGD